jgi:cysteine-rich repeat protein
MLGQIHSRGARGAALLGLLFVVAGLGAARTAGADCSVIAPEGFDQRAFLGSITSPFLTPGLTSDIKVAGDACDQLARSAAADFKVAGVDRPASDFVITIAFVGASSPPLLVLASNSALCGATDGCSVDTLADREIVQIPLPGGGVERRLRFRFPDGLASLGPVRLGVKLASDPQPVALELRTSACSSATGSYVACIDRFFQLDGSCRTADAYLNKPFSGLVAVPKTDFTAICTSGCEDVAPAPTSSQLPIAIDREGNALFAMIYADQLVRVDRGDGLIEPRPRRLSLSIADAAANGFTDDAPAVYAGKPSSFTFEGFPLSPPFNPFVDPTAPAGQIGIWGMADAEATVHFLPRRTCSDDPGRACTANADCQSPATCGAAEFTYTQTGSAVQLPIASAKAQQAFELNSWLDGSLDDAAVAVAEDERLRGAPVNADLAADDIVVELLDRTTGLIVSLRGLITGRGLTQVRVAEGNQDFVVPAVAAEGRTLAFLESEFAEGLANPLLAATGAEALAADLNGNSRLDQSLRVFTLPDDPGVAEAQSLLPPDLNLAVLPDGRFDDGRNLVLSEGKLFFAYSPIQQQPHAFQLVNQSSEGEPGNSFSGQADLSSDGRFLAFVSGANNLFVPDVDSAPEGDLSAATASGIKLRAVTGPAGEFPVIKNGQAVFEYVATAPKYGPAPSRAYLELKLCNTDAGQPNLVALVDLSKTGPNASIVGATPGACPTCGFDGSKAVEFNRGCGKGQSQSYKLVFKSTQIPAGEIGASFKNEGKPERTAIRGPACLDPGLLAGVERVYLRDTDTGTTEMVSLFDRSSCDEPSAASDQPSGNPDVTQLGQEVFFDSAARLTSDDLDGGSDVYVYDAATCHVRNLSAGLEAPSADPASSDDGMLVAFETGAEPKIAVLDRNTDALLDLGPGRDPSLSADGSKLVYTMDMAGVSQVFLVNLAGGVASAPVAVSVMDGAFFEAGAGFPSVANGAQTAFETPPGDENSDVFVRNIQGAVTTQASRLPTGEDLCTSSPCGAFSPSISDDGRYVSYVLSGLVEVDEVVVQDLVTGSITPLTRMAGADGHSLEPSLGASGDFVALTSFASQLGGVAGAGAPNVFLEGPLDPTAERGARLGVLDVSACGAGPCTPTLTDELVSKGASFAGDIAVVGSPVRVIDVNPAPGGISVRSFGREGVDVALSAAWVCAIVTSDALGNPGHFAACGSRAGATLADLALGGVPLAAEKIGLCGDRAIALGADGVLYEANLAFGSAARAVQVARDFELGEGVDSDANGSVDSCLVAFRSREQDLGGVASAVGNRDLDTQDLAMFLLGTDGAVADCRSSATDCPGQACEQFNYQVGRESVVFLVDESEENFGFTPEQDVCSPGSDVNEDGLCDVSVRRCTAGGSLSEGTSFSQAGNVFSEGGFPDGENTVTEAGFCGTSSESVRLGQLCSDDRDCLAQPGETCQRGFVVLSALADTDGDEVPDVFDNCALVPNSDQTNTDAFDPHLVADSFGDACDAYTCGDGIVQDAETCDEGSKNGTPGSSCSASCTCGVAFKVLGRLHPLSYGTTSVVVFGSAAPDGSGCLNLDTKTVGGIAPKSLDATTLRLSATEPTQSCPTSGAAPIFDLSWDLVYKLSLYDFNGDGIKDLLVPTKTRRIGAGPSTTKLYLTGRFRDGAGPLGEGCFESTAPVNMCFNDDEGEHDDD